MLPNKGMALHWFISHIGAFIGILNYIVLAFFFYSVYPSLLIVCLIVAGFGLIINLGIFIHRNEYSRRE